MDLQGRPTGSKIIEFSSTIGYWNLLPEQHGGKVCIKCVLRLRYNTYKDAFAKNNFIQELTTLWRRISITLEQDLGLKFTAEQVK
jgi:hypothetical protein